MPLWNLFSEVFGASISDVINPKSNVAYLMGSFFMIRRKVFEDVGTFQSVCGSIQEDKALRMRIKKAGYDINIVKVDQIVSALWSRDVTSLWHGIARSLADIAIENRSKLVKSLLAIFLMARFAISDSSVYFINYRPKGLAHTSFEIFIYSINITIAKYFVMSFGN